MRTHVGIVDDELHTLLVNLKRERDEQEQARKELNANLLADPAVRSLSERTQEIIVQEYQALGLRGLL